MRATLFTAVCISTALSAARGQHATVVGRVVLRESGEPVGYAAVSVLPHGAQRLASEGGTFVLRGLPPGEVRLRFRRIGLAPTDTALVVGANDTAQVRIEMTRLALELPTVVVDGTCTNRTPFEEKSAVLAALFDQVTQNAERLRLRASERPFEIQAIRTEGIRGGVGADTLRTDTIVRGPLPPYAYAPRRVYRRRGGGVWEVTLPELADVADTAFTNNHCLWYAGQERFGADSVVRVDFEPVPWLAREVDFEGSIFVRVDGYQLVGMVTRLNRIPRRFPKLVAYATRARFDELVSGVPVLAEWEITNTFRDSPVPVVVGTGRVTGVRWLDSPAATRDTARRPPR